VRPVGDTGVTRWAIIKDERRPENACIIDESLA
jgi:hypothetical protein